MRVFLKKAFLLPCFLLCFSFHVDAQKRSKIYDSYVDLYKELAIKHMAKHQIPASIKLAQGLLESGAGTSDLAKKANNHFGIKCHKTWTGKTVRYSDDAPNECFRSYDKVDDSYEDHSLFLKQNGRYAKLFDLKITDYKGWAKGLQAAGYATDKAYANKLIALIENYELYEYDVHNAAKLKQEKKTETKKKDEITINRPIYKTSSGLLYVEVKDGETFSSIADELGFKGKDLLKYNDVPTEDFPLNKNDVVYLEKKKKKADSPFYYHIVIPGESMHSISQLYGIRMDKLYKMNKKKSNYIPMDGDRLKLR